MGRRVGLLGALLLGVAVLAGCGASGGTTNGALNSGSQHSVAGGAGTGYAPAATPGANSGQQPTQQYLVKSLNVGMAMPDTRIAANDLSLWLTVNDPKAQSAGASYTQDGDQYDITMTFQVEASIYPQVKSYLTSYAGNHKGKLIGLQESVQDVTNQYVDAQSRLANLRIEQGRLQTLMGQAQNINDILTIEQRLTDVEGQIEQIEAQLNQLNGQTTFYAVQIQLTPISSYVPPITQPWNPVQVFQAALSSAKSFGEGLATFFIWLLVYLIYIVPAGVITWLVVRFMRRRAARAATVGAPPTASA